MSAELIVVTATDVSAFVDGELPPEERRDVAACAQDDDRVARLVAAWRWQLRLIHLAFGRGWDRPSPDRLTNIVRSHNAHPQKSRHRAP